MISELAISRTNFARALKGKFPGVAFIRNFQHCLSFKSFSMTRITMKDLHDKTLCNKPYHFSWNCDELPEEVNKPLSTKDDCLLVLNNDPQVVIELHHCVELVLVFYEAHILCIGLKLLHIYVSNLSGYQCFDHFFKIDPPIGQLNT